MSPRGLSLLVLVALLAAFAGWALRPSAADAMAADPAAAGSAPPVRPAAGAPDPGATRTTVPVGTEPLAAATAAEAGDGGGAAEAPTDVAMTMRVLAADGDAPLAEVRLLLLQDGRATPLGVTDAQGEAVVRVPPRGPVVVAAHRAGLREAQGSYREAAPPELVLRMDSGAALHGQVVQHRGGAAAGVRVVAVPWRHGIADDEVRACVRGEDSRVPSAVTDAAGRFRIDGLEPGTRHTLHVGGSGFLGADSARDFAAPEDSPVTLKVYPVHAGVVRLRGPDGARPDALPDEVRVSWAVERRTMSEKSLVPADALDVLLSGVETETWIEDPDFDRIALGAWLEDPPAELAAAFFLDLPGYERTKVDARMAPAAAPLPATEVRLQPWSSPTGTIRMRFLNPPPPFDGPSPLGGLGDCIVSMAEPRWYRYYSLLDLSTPMELTGIPYGEAGVTFYFRERFISDAVFHRQTLVGANPVELEYDLEAFASVCFVATRPDGGVHAGALRVELTWLERNRTEELSFRQPPYQSRPLPSGAYRVQVLEPLGPGGVQPPPFEARFPYGQRTILELPRTPD